MRCLSLIVGFCVLLAGGPLGAQENEASYEVFELRHVDAASLAAGLGGSTLMDQMQLLARQAAAAHGSMLIGAIPGPLMQAVDGGMEPLLPDSPDWRSATVSLSSGRGAAEIAASRIRSGLTVKFLFSKSLASSPNSHLTSYSVEPSKSWSEPRVFWYSC